MLMFVIRQVREVCSLRSFIPPHDLLRDFVYRRLWISILISSFGAQITLLALPLTAAVMLDASPTQMGLLTFFEVFPYVLLSLPGGVWLDRVRKLPVYIAGEIAISIAVASVPIAWWFHHLQIEWLYVVAFMIGAVNTIAGTAAQIVLTQIVPRERLIEAHAKNALATSGSEVAGPAAAGALIKLLGAPIALIADAFLLLGSASILRKIRIVEVREIAADADFWQDLKTGLHFVLHHKILMSLAWVVGAWQLAYNATLVVQILFATRILGLSEHAVGLCYVGMGCGTIAASIVGNRLSRRFGPGRCMVFGFALSGLGWGLLCFAPNTAWGILLFTIMLMCYAVGGVFIFINFLALRQAVTPEHLLGRMTSTMRWLILIPAGPGALLGGWLGENFGLRYTLAFSSICALLLAIFAWNHPTIRAIKKLPSLK